MTAKSLMRKNKDGDPFLALLNHRNTPSKDTNTSPAQKFFNHRTRTLLPTHSNLLCPRVSIDSDRARIKESQQTAKTYYDRRSKDLKPLEKGESVMIQPQLFGKKEWTKGTVVDSKGRSYEIQTPTGRIIRRNRVHLKHVPSTKKNSAVPTAPETQGQEAKAQDLNSKVMTPRPATLSPDATPVTQPTRSTRSGRVIKPKQIEGFAYE